MLFVAVPVSLFLSPSRLLVLVCLWATAVYAAFILSRLPGFSWRQAWRGEGWNPRDFKIVVWRFILSTIGIIFLACLIRPDRLFVFPAQRPFFWLLVMVLYPLLSALPQEVIFRTFFFRRYACLFPSTWLMLMVNAVLFGFIHIVFHNPVSPFLSLLCGFFLGGSYLSHQSLKKASIEHALYGDMVFTVGLGLYFLVHGS